MKRDIMLMRCGLPTKMDVDSLLSEIGVPKPGDKIPYERIQQVIKISKDTYRWRTVVNSWRKRLFREHNIVLDSIINEGFEALNNNDRISFTAKKINSGTRMIMRAVNIAQTTDTNGLDEESLRNRNHYADIPRKLKLAFLTEPKDMPY